MPPQDLFISHRGLLKEGFRLAMHLESHRNLLASLHAMMHCIVAPLHL